MPYSDVGGISEVDARAAADGSCCQVLRSFGDHLDLVHPVYAVLGADHQLYVADTGRCDDRGDGRVLTVTYQPQRRHANGVVFRSTAADSAQRPSLLLRQAESDLSQSPRRLCLTPDGCLLLGLDTKLAVYQRVYLTSIPCCEEEILSTRL